MHEVCRERRLDVCRGLNEVTRYKIYTILGTLMYLNWSIGKAEKKDDSKSASFESRAAFQELDSSDRHIIHIKPMRAFCTYILDLSLSMVYSVSFNSRARRQSLLLRYFFLLLASAHIIPGA